MDRVTVPEAARILGIKEESVRKRVSRGKLRADKDAEGRLLVWVDSTQTVRDESVTDRSGERDLLYEEMRERIAYLERQVEEEREARRRADTLLARLMDSVPALEPPADAPAPAQASEEPAEGAADSVAGVRVAQADTGAQNATERPWWKFWS